MNQYSIDVDNRAHEYLFKTVRNLKIRSMESHEVVRVAVFVKEERQDVNCIRAHVCAYVRA
jgi:hypothetical protein